MNSKALSALVFVVFVYPEEAWGGCTFDNWCAEIYSKWANPDPSQPDTGIQLCAEIGNQTTNDEYDGEATFNIDFEVEVPGLNPVVTRRQSFGVWETRIVCVAYTTGNPGVYTTTVRVETAGGAGRNVEVGSFTFTVEEDPCADVVCNDRCDGDTAVTNESCDDGVCIGGNMENCNADDRSEIAYYCNNGDKWSERLRYDSWCNVGACVGQCLAPTNQQSFQDCLEGGWSSWSYYCSGSERHRVRHYIDRGCRREAIACGNNGLSITSAQCFATDDFNREQDERDQNCQWGCSNGDCNPDPCADENCNDYCNGNTRIWNRRCNNGACDDGEPLNCDVMDVRTPTTYCNGNELWQHTWFVDYSCSGGTCDDAPGRWLNDDQGVSNCAFGCEAALARCRPDPCANVVCADRCSGNARMAGRCINGQCFYDQVEDCNDRDVIHGDRQFYCNADSTSVRSRQAMDDYFCAAGGCVGRSMWAGDRPEERCTDYCAGSESVQGRACQNGACTEGNRVDCNSMDTEPRSVHICDGDEVHAFDAWRDFSCNPAIGLCDAGSDQTGPIRPFEDCTVRPPVRREVDGYCTPEDLPVLVYETLYWGCEDSECAVTSVEQEEVFGECQPWERCLGGDCVNADCRITDGEWLAEHAVDGDRIGMRIFYEGACQGTTVDVAVKETDGRLLDLFPRGRGAGRVSVALGRGQFTDGEWVATFVEDWGDIAEYRFHVELAGENMLEGRDVLMVEPRVFNFGTIGDILAEVPPVNAPCPDYGMVTLSYECIHAREAAGVVGEVTNENTIDGEDVLEWVGILYIADCIGCVGGLLVAGAAVYLCPATFGVTCVTVFPWVLGFADITCAICAGGEPAGVGVRSTARREAAQKASTVVVRIGSDVREAQLVVEEAIVERTATGARFTYRLNDLPVVEEVLYKTERTLPSIRYINPPFPHPGGVQMMDLVTVRQIPANWMVVSDSEAGMRAVTSLFIDNGLTATMDSVVASVSRGRFTLEDVMTVEGLRPGITFVNNLDEGDKAAAQVFTGEILIDVRPLLNDWEAAVVEMRNVVIKQEVSHLTIGKFIRQLPDPLRPGQNYRLNNNPNQWWNEYAEEYLTDRLVLGSLQGVSRDQYEAGVINRLEWAQLALDRLSVSWVRDGNREAKWELVYYYTNARDLGHDVEAQVLSRVRRASQRHAPERAAEIEQEFTSAANQLRDDGSGFVRDLYEHVSSALLDALLRLYGIIEDVRARGNQPNVSGDAGVPQDPRELAEQDAGEGDSTDPRGVRRRDGGVSESDASLGGLDAASEDATDMTGLLYVNCDELPSYAFDSPEDCRLQVPTDKQSACDRLVLGRYICPRPGGACACRLNVERSADPSALFLFALAFVAFITRLTR